MLIRIAAALFLLWLLYRFLRSVILSKLDKAMREARQGGGEIAEMERDPVCGKYVSAGQSVMAEKGGQVYHFCSRECRDRFLDS